MKRKRLEFEDKKLLEKYMNPEFLEKILKSSELRKEGKTRKKNARGENRLKYVKKKIIQGKIKKGRH